MGGGNAQVKPEDLKKGLEGENRTYIAPAVGLQVSWGTTSHLSSAGGEYRLCWCAGVPITTNATAPGQARFRCSVAENFRVDLGELTLIGPAPLWQYRTCVSGQTCKLDGILGQDLEMGDHVATLDTCGTQQILLPRSANTGFVTEMLSTGAVVSWGSVQTTSQGGEYRLCWCSASSHAEFKFACSTAEHFRTDTGEFTLIGVAPLNQDRTCASGQTCTFDGIRGQDLHATDLFAVSD